MDGNTRRAAPTAAQLNWLLFLSLVVPAVAMLGLGFWLIHEATAASPMPADTEMIMWSATFGAAIVSAVVITFAWMRSRNLVKSQALELADICRQVVGGQRSVRAPVVGEDEFAVLSAAVNALADGAPAGGRMGSEGHDAATLQAQIEKLLQEVSAVGDGDLRVQAEVTPDTLGVLADSFNYMIEELAKVVGRVQATTFQVTNATRRLLDRSAEVAAASTTQSAQISQTTESVSSLADFVKLSAENAASAADAAREALRNADGGQQAVVQTIDGMLHIRENVQETAKKIKRLGERSQEVGEIVRLIEDIADQTNLLALNAAIQSAMAGEHGRGFAVVADEIRQLAERVTEATKKIATIVKSIQGDTYEAVVAMEESTQEVVNGSRLADEAGDALRSIYLAVDRQATMIEGIAQAAHERATTSSAVAATMSRIAEIAMQTNNATQDTTAAVSYLAELAEQLRASVATFRLPEGATQSPALLPQPDGMYPPPLDLPFLDGLQWGGDQGRVPALPGAAAGGRAYGDAFPPGYDFGGLIEGGYQGYYDAQQGSSKLPLAPSIVEQPFEQQTGDLPFTGDLY
jgi:methyl-accepting chemotaxis protein